MYVESLTGYVSFLRVLRSDTDTKQNIKKLGLLLKTPIVSTHYRYTLWTHVFCDMQCLYVVRDIPPYNFPRF